MMKELIQFISVVNEYMVLNYMEANPSTSKRHIYPLMDHEKPMEYWVSNQKVE